MTSLPLPVRLYSSAANLIGPLAYRRISAKLEAQGIPRARLPERKGRATQPRPQGPLLWLHAASVGESLSVLRLVEHLGEMHSELSFLLTSGTATSAQIVADRLPARCRHQFAPLDTKRAVQRFLDHWMPSAAIFVESELWPHMLSRTHAAGVPMALVNARISERSARNWKRAPSTARYLMQHFRLIHCQDDRTAAHLHDLGLSHAAKGQNLKSLSGPLPFDAKEKNRIEAELGSRPFWLASSTHPGEDELMIAAHKAVLRTHSDALLILVPRHPERAEAITGLISKSGLENSWRSKGGGISSETQVYLADTLGETGLWYALSPLTCLCGSFVPVGGHNPYEPAYAASAILHGPLYANFETVYQELDASGAARQVADEFTLSEALQDLMADRSKLDAMRENATGFTRALSDGLAQLARNLSNVLELG